MNKDETGYLFVPASWKALAGHHAEFQISQPDEFMYALSYQSDP